MIGRPAPTVVSCRMRRSCVRAVCWSASASASLPERGRLFARTTSIPAPSALAQQRAGVVGGEIDEDRARQCMTSDRRERVRRGCGDATVRRAQSRAACLLGRETREPPGRDAVRVEDVAAPIDDADDARARSVLARASRALARVFARSVRIRTARRPRAPVAPQHRRPID